MSRYIFRIAASLLCLMLCTYSIQSLADVTSITPKVKVYGVKGPSGALATTLTTAWKIVYPDSTDSAEWKAIADHLHDKLQAEFNIDIPVQPLSGNVGEDSNQTIVLGDFANQYIKNVITFNDLEIETEPARVTQLGEEGYLIDVHPKTTSEPQETIAVLAGTAKGVFHGIQSLLRAEPYADAAFQLLFINGSGGITIDPVYVADWPDKSIRGMYTTNEKCVGSLYAGHEADCKNQELSDLLNKMVRWKMDFMAVGPDTPTTTDLAQLFVDAKNYYVEPVPILKGLGSGGYFMYTNPNTGEGIQVTNEQFTFTDPVTANGIEQQLVPVQPVDQTATLKNNSFENGAALNTTTLDTGGSDWYSYILMVCPVALDSNGNCASELVPLGEWSYDTSEHSDGQRSAKLSTPMDLASLYKNTYGSGITLDNIPVESDKTYVVSFYAMTQGLGSFTGQQPRVSVGQYDQNYNPIPGLDASITTVNLPIKDTYWTQYFITVPRLPPSPTPPFTRKLQISASHRQGGYGTFWLDKFELLRMDGALGNVIKTANTNIKVTSLDGATTYIEGTHYTVDTAGLPTLNYNGVFFPLIESTAISRNPDCVSADCIPAGATVKLSYDFALNVYSDMCYSINDDATYRDAVYPYINTMMSLKTASLIEIVPDYVFYQGVDEIRGISRDSRNGTDENYLLLAKDIVNVFAQVKLNNSAAKMIVWDDMFNPWSNGDDENTQFLDGGAKGSFEPKNMNLHRVTDEIKRLATEKGLDWKDIIPNAWDYGGIVLDKNKNPTIDIKGIIRCSPWYYADRGFDWLGSPEANIDNIKLWASVIVDNPEYGCPYPTDPTFNQGTKHTNKGLIDYAPNTYAGVQPTANYAWNNTQNTVVIQDTDGDGSLDSFDLEQTSVSGRPASAIPGEVISVTDTVTNKGVMAVSAFTVGLYLSTDITITTDDTHLANRQVSELSFGTINTASTGITLPTGLAPGTYYLGAIADSTYVIAETNENNNTNYTPINIQAVLTVSTTGAGGGTITSGPEGIDCGATCTGGYNANTSVTLTASAANDSVLSSWSGCASTSGNTCTVTMDTNKTVTANFNKSADLAVTITGSPNTVLLNGTVTYNVTVTNNGPSGATGVSLSGLTGCAPALPTSLANGASANCSATVTATAVGTMTQTVSVSGNETDSVPGNNSATATTIVNPASQSITPTAPSTAAYGDIVAVTPTTTGTSTATNITWTGSGGCSGTGSRVVTSTNTGAITNSVKMTSGSVSCTVTYNRIADLNYTAAPQVTSTTTATKASQTITPTAPVSVATGATVAVTPTTTGTSTTTNITWTGSGGCTGTGSRAVNSNNTGAITNTVKMATSPTSACVVTYNRIADVNYSAAQQVTSTTKVTQTIPPTAPASAAAGAAVAVTPTTTGTSTTTNITWTSSGGCTGTGSRVVNSNNTGAITNTVKMATSPTSACVVTYARASDKLYDTAPTATSTTKIVQTITFGAQTSPRTYVLNTTFSINPLATASSGIAATYSASPSTVCTLSSTTLTMKGTGTCNITASQAGNTAYAAATPVTQSVKLR